MDEEDERRLTRRGRDCGDGIFGCWGRGRRGVFVEWHFEVMSVDIYIVVSVARWSLSSVGLFCVGSRCRLSVGDQSFCGRVGEEWKLPIVFRHLFFPLP